MNVLFVPVVLLLPVLNPINVFATDVVTLLPLFRPIKRLVLLLAFLISLTTVPLLFVNVVVATLVDVCDLTLNTSVPSKSVVGVIVKTPVVVANGPQVPVAVILELDTPPKVIVIEPAVLPVIVYAI